MSAGRIDVLAVMAAAAACLHDSGMPLTAADLRQARAAMRPLKHPLDGYGPDLISPETAAYFNALVGKAA